MTMEHITVTTLSNGMVRLNPEPGYALLNTITNKVYSEAVVEEKDIHNYKAVEIEPITE